MSDRRWTMCEGLALFAVLLLAVVIRIPSLWEPIGSDQAIGAVIADALRHGGVLYRDIWDQHTPLAYYIHAIGQILFGRTTRTIYLLDLLWSLANMLALYGLTRRWHGRATPLLGAGLYTLFSNSVAFNQATIGTWTMRVKAESLMTLPLAGGFYATLRAVAPAERRPWLWWGLAGLALGFATALKPVAVLFLIGVWLILLVVTFKTHLRKCLFRCGESLRRFGSSFQAQSVFTRRESFPHQGHPQPSQGWLRKLAVAVRHTLWLGGGFLLAQLVYLIPTLAQGTLPDFWRAVVLYNFGPYSVIGLSRTRFLVVSVLIGKETFGLWLLAAAGLLWMLLRDRRLGNWLIVGWWLLSGVILVLQNKFFSYQYLPLLPPLCLLAAYSVAQLWRLAGRWRVRPAAWALRGLLVFLLLASVARFALTNGPYYSRFLRFASGRMDADTFYGAFNTYPRHYSYPADRAVADWVRERTGPDEPLGTLGGYGATPIWLAERPPAARYVFTYQLFHKGAADFPLIQTMRAEFLADLQASQPPYIVFFRPPGEFQPFGPLYEWLTANYELEREFAHGRTLYRRRPIYRSAQR